MRQAFLIALCWVLLRPTVRQLQRVLRLLALIDLYGGAVPDEREISFREATLTADQHAWLLALAKAATVPHGQARVKAGAVDALQAARVTELAPHPVDWDKLEREAARRGGDLVDLCFDKAHRKERTE